MDILIEKFFKNYFPYLKHGNIVLHEFQTIYFFIPKVACTSIKRVMSDLLHTQPPDPSNPDNYIHRRKYPFVKKNKILSQYGHYFKFCFVRNPWDRIVSCYNNKIFKDKKINRYTVKNGVAIELTKFGNMFWAGMSFDDFVRSVRDIPDQKADSHFRSQYMTIFNRKNKLLVDFIGKFENLENDFSLVCRRVGFPEIKLPHLMKYDHKHYSEFYSDHSKDIIKERFSSDIEIFEYDF